jgi:hypothetical protein
MLQIEKKPVRKSNKLAVFLVKDNVNEINLLMGLCEFAPISAYTSLRFTQTASVRL